MTRATDARIRLVRAHEQAELRRAHLSTLAYSPDLAEHLARETAAPRPQAIRGSDPDNSGIATGAFVDEREPCERAVAREREVAAGQRLRPRHARRR